MSRFKVGDKVVINSPLSILNKRKGIIINNVNNIYYVKSVCVFLADELSLNEGN